MKQSNFCTVKISRSLVLEVFDIAGAQCAAAQLTPEAARDLSATLDEFARGTGASCAAKTFIADAARGMPARSNGPIKLRIAR